MHCSGLHCLFIKQAALGNSQANLHCSGLHCLFIRQAALGNSQVNLHCSRLHCLCRDSPTRQARGCRHGQLRPAKLRHLSQTGHHNHHLLHFIGVKTACHCCPQGGMSPNRRLPTCAVMRLIGRHAGPLSFSPAGRFRCHYKKCIFAKRQSSNRTGQMLKLKGRCTCR